MSGFRNYITTQIKRRSVLLRLASAMASDGAEVMSATEAKAQAARELAEQQRSARQRRATPSPIVAVTVSNARAVLLARLSAMGERIAASAVFDAKRAAAAPTARSHTDDPIKPYVPIHKQQQAEPEVVGNQTLGLFANTSPAFIRIEDAEYEPRYLDLTTQNWRRSIVENEKRKSERWIG